MAEASKDGAKSRGPMTREERLAAQLRANLRRRKAAARKTACTEKPEKPEKDAPQP
ncbi:hypothetical protein [uncultured Algimonas sp.]|uniref:hypothetical protein n=1 Tax=uncultured Algimonas sp. TaxID=1547920 RepID=UPI00261411AC|nr:hypothetical protein [uncultured Algimonas sp.]